jgi:hypothetical protein
LESMLFTHDVAIIKQFITTTNSFIITYF